MPQLTSVEAIDAKVAWARAIGAVAALWVVNLVATLLLIAIGRTLGWPSTPTANAAMRIGGAILGEGVFLLLLVAWMKREHTSLDDLGIRRSPRVWALLAAIGFGVLYGVLTLSNPGIRHFAGTLGPLKAEAVIAALVAGIVEETTSRGYVMAQLGRARTSTSLQIVASGLLFGLAHFNYSFYGILSATIIGLVFAAVYIYGRRALIPVMAGHAVIDLIIEPGLVLWVLAGFPIPR